MGGPKDERDQRQELDDLNNERAGNETGRMTRFFHDRDPEALEQKRRDEEAKDAYRAAVLAEINRISARLEVLYQQRDRILDELDAIKGEQSQLEAWRSDLEAGIAPDLNENGSLADDRLEALVAAHEQRMGHSVDRSDPAVLLAIIAAEQAVQDAAYKAKLDELRDINEQIKPLEGRLNELQGGRSLDGPAADENERAQQAEFRGTFEAQDYVRGVPQFDDFTP